MTRRALSLGLAGVTLALALYLSTGSLWVLGPVLFFPFIGGPAVAGAMAGRVALMRRLGGASDPTARALEVIALGSMFAAGAGLLLALCALPPIPTMCGVASAADVATVLGRCWVPVCAAELVTTGALVVRGAALVALPWYEAIATVLTLAVATPLAVVACISAYTETEHGGASTVVLVPAAIAAGSTGVTWVRGRPLAFAAALRRLVGVTTIGCVGLVTVLPKGARTCRSFGTTDGWGLVSLSGSGWALLLLGGLLLFARDPRSTE